MTRIARTACSLSLLSGLVAGQLLTPAAEEGLRQRRSLTPGERGFALSAIEGRQVNRIPLTYLGTYYDFAGPGLDLLLVRLEGPVAERVGVAAGMSGSPVHFDGELVGALAYRLGRLPGEPVAGVTPIEDMLRAAKLPTVGGAPSASVATPIRTPVQIGGLAPAVQEWIAPQFEELGFVTVGGGGAASERSDVVPGAPIGVELVRGDMRVAATGTVTHVEGQRVYAFGHPFLGAGRVELPMVSAEVIHTLADLAGSVKLTNVGGVIGAFVEDRFTALVGRRDLQAKMIPIELGLSGADYGAQRLRFEVARHRQLTPTLVGLVVTNSVATNLGFDQSGTLLVRGSIRVGSAPALPFEGALAPDGGLPAAMLLGNALRSRLETLLATPWQEVEIEGIEIELLARRGIVRYRLEELNYDRGPLKAGGTLLLECVLRRHRGGRELRRIELALPPRSTGSTELELAVGSADQVERALGRPLQRRLSSAENLRSWIEAAGERRAAHRLQAVLYERSPGMIAAGEHYENLPPSAERLLEAAGGTGSQRSTVSVWTRAEIELEGPLESRALVGRVSIAAGVPPGKSGPAREARPEGAHR